MPELKSRKSVDEHFKLAAVQRLQASGMSAKELAKELDVSIWSLRKWSRGLRIIGRYCDRANSRASRRSRHLGQKSKGLLPMKRQ